MTDTIPFPLPDLMAEPLAPFWRAAQRGELRMPRCRGCGRIDWYPKQVCRGCGSVDMAWSRLSGAGTLFSWAIVRRALDPGLAPLVPYVSAIVTLAEDPSSRLVTRLIDMPDAAIATGMALRARFVDLGWPHLETGIIAPLFSLSATNTVPGRLAGARENGV